MLQMLLFLNVWIDYKKDKKKNNFNNFIKNLSETSNSRQMWAALRNVKKYQKEKPPNNS